MRPGARKEVVPVDRNEWREPRIDVPDRADRNFAFMACESLASLSAAAPGLAPLPLLVYYFLHPGLSIFQAASDEFQALLLRQQAYTAWARVLCWARFECSASITNRSQR